jgi:pimeloyl-ACP methyl ester carboxylesterase
MSARPAKLQLAPYRLRDTEAELGTLRVPVRHAAPEAATLELRFVRLKSRAVSPGPAIIFLTGGPGLSGIRSGEGRLFPMFDALRDHSDVILLDQRACVPVAILRDRVMPKSGRPLFPTGRAVSRDEYLRVIRHAVHDEGSYLGLNGIPAGALNTMESADDIAMLSRTLYGDSARTALLGWSYGSHLAMAVLKRHRSLVSRAVLAAPEGPDHTLKRPVRIQEHLERLSARAAFDLTGAAATAFGHLAQRPRPFAVPADSGTDFAHHVIGRFELEWILSEVVADPRALRKLPAWLARMERGDFGMIGREPLLLGAWDALRHELPHSIGRYAMDCASGATAERRALIAREADATLLGNTIDFPLPDICDAVGCPDLGDEFRAAPRSDVPVLFITGTLDCRTPAENVDELAPGLPNHQHVVVEDAGHSDLLFAAGVQEAIVRFIAGGPAGSRVKADALLTFDTE